MCVCGSNLKDGGAVKARWSEAVASDQWVKRGSAGLQGVERGQVQEH